MRYLLNKCIVKNNEINLRKDMYTDIYISFKKDIYIYILYSYIYVTNLRSLAWLNVSFPTGGNLHADTTIILRPALSSPTTSTMPYLDISR